MATSSAARNASTTRTQAQSAVHDAPANDDTSLFELPEMPAPEEATLPCLRARFGDADETCRTLTFGAHDTAELVELGIRSDTAPIVESIPTLVVSTVTVLRGLTAEQAGYVLLDVALLGVLVDETVRLVATRQSYDLALGTSGVASGNRRRTQRDLRAEAIALRTNTVDGVIRALGSAHAESVRAAAGHAETDNDLAQGLAGLADHVHDILTRGSDGDRARLTRSRIGATRVHALRAKAAAVRALVEGKGALAPRTALQRALDVQEGRVLLLARKIVSALRAARAVDEAIPAVQLGRLATLLSPRSTPRKRKPSSR